MCLSQNADLLVEIVDLLILCVSECTKICVVYVDDFDGDDFVTAGLTSDLMSVELSFKE